MASVETRHPGVGANPLTRAETAAMLQMARRQQAVARRGGGSQALARAAAYVEAARTFGAPKRGRVTHARATRQAGRAEIQSGVSDYLRRKLGGNPAFLPGVPDLVRFGVARYQVYGEKELGLTWAMAPRKAAEDVDRWLVAIKHPLAYESGTAEHRFRVIVRALATVSNRRGKGQQRRAFVHENPPAGARVLGILPASHVVVTYKRAGRYPGWYRHVFKPGVRLQCLADGSVRIVGPRPTWSYGR